MQSKATQSSRRRFLRRLGMITGAGALAALGTRHTARADEDLEVRSAKSRQGQGYRLTAHIRSYYRTAGR